jgi:hypothetical protein
VRGAGSHLAVPEGSCGRKASRIGTRGACPRRWPNRETLLGAATRVRSAQRLSDEPRAVASVGRIVTLIAEDRRNEELGLVSAGGPCATMAASPVATGRGSIRPSHVQAAGARKGGPNGGPRSGRPGKPADGEAPAMAGNRRLPNGCMAGNAMVSDPDLRRGRPGGSDTGLAEERTGTEIAVNAGAVRRPRAPFRRGAGERCSRSRGGQREASWSRRTPAPGLPTRRPRYPSHPRGCPAGRTARGRSE